MDSSSRGRSEDAARLTVVRVPLSPEMQRGMEAARKLEAAMDAELERLLTPEGRQRIIDGDREFTRRVLFGEEAPGSNPGAPI